MIDQSGVTPLFLACYIGDKSVVNVLLEMGATPLKQSGKASPLHICAERGFVEIAMLLLNKFPWLVYEVDELGNTALHVACEWD